MQSLGEMLLAGEGLRKILRRPPCGSSELRNKATCLHNTRSALVSPKESECQRMCPNLWEWFRKAAAQGHVQATHQMGKAYYGGVGVERNLETAAKYFEAAAEMGSAQGAYLIATRYNKGEGVPKDTAKTQKWMALAAERGNPSAQYILGRHYATRAVPRDFVESAKWLRLAVASGLPQVKKELKTTEAQLTPEQSAEVEKRVQTFLRNQRD